MQAYSMLAERLTDVFNAGQQLADIGSTGSERESNGNHKQIVLLIIYFTSR